MKKALMLTGFDPAAAAGGIETFSREIITLLGSLGMRAEVVAASDHGNPYGFSNEFIGRVYASGRNLRSIPVDEYEFVIANGYYGGGYFPKHIKTITVFHSTHAGYAESIKSFVPLGTYLEIRHIIGEVLERTAAWTAEVVAVSANVKAELNDNYNIGEVKVIANPVDIDFFRPMPDVRRIREQYGIPMTSKVGLYVGRWETSKGMDIVNRLILDRTDIFWIIAAASGGESPPPEGIVNVRSFSELDKTRMRELYNCADFMLFPSRYEGFGLAAAEAMSCGLPVIGSPVGFLGDVFSRPLFSPFSIPITSSGMSGIVSAVNNSIRRLLSDEPIRDEISKAGRQIIMDNYDITSWREKMRGILCPT